MLTSEMPEVSRTYQVIAHLLCERRQRNLFELPQKLAMVMRGFLYIKLSGLCGYQGQRRQSLMEIRKRTLLYWENDMEDKAYPREHVSILRVC